MRSIMIIVVVFALLFGAGIAYTKYEDKEECKQFCEDYRAEFISFDRSGFASDECWCKLEGKPLRVK